MIQQNLAHERKTNPLSIRFGAKERRKKSLGVLGGNARTIVYDRKTWWTWLDMTAKRTPITHRLKGILDDVDQRLLNLGWVELKA